MYFEMLFELKIIEKFYLLFCKEVFRHEYPKLKAF